MLCTFCGTDNRPENKFCGMCGVRLERRKVERRVFSSNTNRICPSCEHVNEQGYKFCAMCGSRVERRLSERREEEPRATAIANALVPGPEGRPVAVSEAEPAADTTEVLETLSPATKPSPPVAHHPPYRSTTIVGPSFLGLSDESGETADYLLEEERSSGGVLRKLVLIAVLAAVGGLVFVQWKAGFPILNAVRRSAEPAKTGADSSQDKNPSSEEDKSANSSDDVAKDTVTPVGETVVTKDRIPDVTSIEKPNVPKTITGAATDEGSAGDEQSKLKAAKDEPEKPSPLLLRAQQYLQGTGGVSQNCEQGLIYLRAAAKSEAAAALQMGALYASGHCVQPDRVAAYRWLNSAHELQPGNARIQNSMNQLWALMTLQERSQIAR